MDIDGDGDGDYSERNVTVEITGAALRPTMLPLLRLKFNFSFTSETSSWISLEDDSTTLEFAATSERRASATVAIGGASLRDDARAAIEEAVGDSLLTEGERGDLLVAVWSETREILPAAEPLPMFGVLEVDVAVLVEERRVVVGASSGGGEGMVPAADSALEMLEKCDAERGWSCSICLEEFGGGGGGGRGGFRMPCKHVFHGGCIKKWLRKSHYCPLCRYEMPAAAAAVKEGSVDEFDEDDIYMIVSSVDDLFD